jgi:hypothetical protein
MRVGDQHDLVGGVGQRVGAADVLDHPGRAADVVPIVPIRP